MGILAMNITDFGLPGAAYMNPVAYGTQGPADLAAWALNFILLDGKMRGLFSLLFGASMLLVIERAAAKGEPPASTHFRRMLWLALFGLLHYYLIWHGDILFGYAVAGMAAWFFRNMAPSDLIKWGVGFVVVQLLLFMALAVGIFLLADAVAGPEPAAGALDAWAGKQEMFGIAPAGRIEEILALYRGSWSRIVEHRVMAEGDGPFVGLLFFSWETIGYMLFGMAALKTGFLKGEWAPESYRRTAILCLGIALPVYAILAAILYLDGFSVPMVAAIWLPATVPVRPVAIVGTAALIILLTRSGGPLVERIAAAGRAAFTNYLGTSIAMSTLFFGYGGGLFGRLSRVELWIVVLAAWAVMLLWSKPWLERHLYGPFEWAWRSLSRWSLQPMRKPAAAPAPAE
jgi:uncharacterized protein